MEIKANELPLFEYHKLWDEAKSAFEFKENDTFFDQADGLSIQPLLNWWVLYELDFTLVSGIFYSTLVEPDTVREEAILNPENVIRSGDRLCKELGEAYKNATKKDLILPLSILLNVSMPLKGNLEAISIFGLGSSICELLARARDHADEKALFNAILIDKTCINTPTAQRYIAQAVLSNNNNFFDKLSRAIKGSRPRNSSPELDDVRLMEALAEDFKPSNRLSQKEICSLFIDQLGIYEDEGKDPCGSLWRHIQRIRKKY